MGLAYSKQFIRDNYFYYYVITYYECLDGLESKSHEDRLHLHPILKELNLSPHFPNNEVLLIVKYFKIIKLTFI